MMTTTDKYVCCCWLAVLLFICHWWRIRSVGYSNTLYHSFRSPLFTQQKTRFVNPPDQRRSRRSTRVGGAVRRRRPVRGARTERADIGKSKGVEEWWMSLIDRLAIVVSTTTHCLRSMSCRRRCTDWRSRRTSRAPLRRSALDVDFLLIFIDLRFRFDAWLLIDFLRFVALILWRFLIVAKRVFILQTFWRSRSNSLLVWRGFCVFSSFFVAWPNVFFCCCVVFCGVSVRDESSSRSTRTWCVSSMTLW